MEITEEKINIDLCWLANYYLGMINGGQIENLPLIEFLPGDDFEVKTLENQFFKVKVSEIDLSKELSKLSKVELARLGIIMVERSDVKIGKEFSLVTDSSFLDFPQRCSWFKIEKI